MMHEEQLTFNIEDAIYFFKKQIAYIIEIIKGTRPNTFFYARQEAYKRILSDSLELITNLEYKCSLNPSLSELKTLLRDLKWLRNNLRNIERHNALYYDFDDIKHILNEKELHYIRYILKLIEKKATTCGINIDSGAISYKTPYYADLANDHPIKIFINTDKRLVELNKLRIRNVIIFDNPTHQIIYDLVDKETKIIPKIRVSDFEHDTNRKYLEEVCRDFLFNFDPKKEYYIKLLKKHKNFYVDQINILIGAKKGTVQETLTLISLLGRLHQENIMGPISTYRNEKLYPTYISKNITALTYARETIKTLVEYSKVLLFKSEIILKIPNINRGIVAYDELFSNTNEYGLLEQIMDTNIILEADKLPMMYEAEEIFRPNYLQSFFAKFVENSVFEPVTPLFNSNEDLNDLIAYSKRYQGNPNKQDFMISAKTRSILMNQSSVTLKHAIHEVFMYSKNNAYSRKVAAYLIDQDENILKELMRGFFIFDNYVEKEKAKFQEEREIANDSEYNNTYLSISSDMHFNELDNYEKSNFSTNFNIIAGDFADNLYHRGNSELEGIFTLSGVGVLGNHDVYLDSTPTKNLTREI